MMDDPDGFGTAPATLVLTGVHGVQSESLPGAFTPEVLRRPFLSLAERGGIAFDHDGAP